MGRRVNPDLASIISNPSLHVVMNISKLPVNVEGFYHTTGRKAAEVRGTGAGRVTGSSFFSICDD